MSNTNNKIIDGLEFNNNISIIKDCNGKGGSLEAEDTIFSDIFLSYTLNTPISLANSLFNQDGSVIITSSSPVNSCSTTSASLVVNGGILVKKDSVISGILRICNTTNSYDNSNGSLIVSGGASIYQNLSLNGVLSIFNTTSSTSTSGSIITLGGITIKNSTNSTNISNGGALTVLGGASFLGDIYSNNFYGNQIVVTNGNFGFITSSNILVSNGNFINLSTNSLISTTISSASIYSNNISSTKNSVLNLVATYSTFANVLVLNEMTTNLTVNSLYNNNGFMNNINVTNGNISSLTVGNLYVINNIEYNDIVTNLSTANIISTFASIGSLQLNIGTFGSLHGIIGNSFIYSDTISTSNLLSISVISTNASIANLTVSSSKITLATIDNLQVTNGFITNFSSTNSIITNGTVSTLYSNSGNINNFNSNQATINYLQITSSTPSISSTEASLTLYFGGLSINNTSDVTSISSGGGLTDAGGASIAKSLLVGNTVSALVVSTGSIYSNLNTNNFNVSIYSTSGKLFLTDTTPSYSSTFGALVSAGGISINCTTDVTSITSGGGLTDAGGASIAKSLLVGGTIGATVISSGSGIIGSLNTVNFSAQNALLTNVSITNLSVSSQTVNNLFVNNSSTANANFTNISTQNLNSSSANISNLIFTNGSYGNLVGNYFTANYITNNISLTSQNATISTLTNSNASIQNLQITNGTFGGLIGNNFDAYTGSIGTLVSLNSSIGNLYNINNTSINQVSTNITTGSIIGINANFIYATIGTLFSPNIVTNSLTIGTLSVAQNSIGSLNLNYETVGNSLILNLTNGNSYITNSSIQNITNVYISSSNGSFVNITAGNGNIINIFSTNGSFTNISSQNIYSNFIYITSASLINSTLSNTYITNSTITNIYSNYSTISNLYSGNGNITNITNTNIVSTNGTFTNLLATNTTSVNLTVTNETITTLNATGATFGNINFTGTLYQNGLPYIASQWISFGPNIAFTTGNVGINTTNPRFALDVIGTGHFTQNVNIDGTISTSNIYASNISVGNINNAISISSRLLSSTNVFSTNSTTTNLISSNSTISNSLLNSSTINNLYNNIATIGNLYINGSGPSYNSTTAAFILFNGGISVNCTVNSTGISSGGAATLAGGLAIFKDTYIGGDIHITGASYITGNTWLNSPLDLNKNVINNVTSPSFDLQVANKYYVDNRFLNFTVGNVNGNFTQGQVIVATTGGNIVGFNNFTFNGITLTLNSTEDATSLTHGGALQVYGGASIDQSLFVGSNAHILGYLDMNNQKIMSVATPTMPYDGVNKYYVDNRFSQFTIGNVSGNFTQGQVLVSSTAGHIIGYSDFLYDGTLLSLTSTNNSLGLGSGGTLNVYGGVSILGNVYIGNKLDLNGNLITNVTSPSSNLDVANKYYVDNRFNQFTIGNVSGNFTQGQVIVAGTGGNITGFSDFLFDGTLLSLTSTNNSLGLGSGGILTVFGGASFLKNVYFGSPIDLNNQKITNVALPTNLLDGVNKYYVDNRFNQFTIGNVSGNFTQGQVIVATTSGNITGFSDFLFDGTLLSLTSTNNSLGLGSGGTLTVFGGASFLKNVYFGSSINLNNQTIYNVTAPSYNLQVANKWYVDNRFLNFTVGNVNGNFTRGQVIIAGTGGNILSYPNLLFDGNLLSINSTVNSIGLNSGGTLNVNGGASILGNVYLGGILNVEGNSITNVPIPINQLDAVNKEYVDFFLGIGTGDIPNTSILLNNNIITFTNINSFVFSNTQVSSFVSYAYLQIPELNIYDQFELRGLLKNTTWELNTSFIGDLFHGLSFSILNTGSQGQIQYKNKNTSGTALLSFRAITTNQGLYVNITTSSLIRSISGGGTGSTFFTQGTLLLGNGINPINTDINLSYNNKILYIGNTDLSTGLTSGGVLQINGGVNINQNVFIGGNLDVGKQRITNCTAPSLYLDVANKWYVDSKIKNSLNVTTDATNATTGGAFTDLGGAGIAKKLYVGTKLFVDNINLTPSIGDIFYEQQFLANVNQNTPADITNFSFDNSTVRYFQGFCSIHIITSTTTIDAGFELKGLQTKSGWLLNSTLIGDHNIGISLNITNTGQIQYTSSNIANWISTTINFRCLTTTIIASTNKNINSPILIDLGSAINFAIGCYGAFSIAANANLTGNIITSAAFSTGDSSIMNGNADSVGAISLGINSQFNGKLICQAAISIAATEIFTGDMYSTAAITIGAGSQVYGNILACTTIALGASATVSGIILSGSNSEIVPNSNSVQVINDITTAYNNLLLVTGLDFQSSIINNRLFPGTYIQTGALAVAAGSTIIFSGNSNDTWIIQISGAISFGGNITLVGGALASNIQWVSTGAFAIAANSIFYGTIVTSAAISIGSGASLYGSAFSTSSAVSILAGAYLIKS